MSSAKKRRALNRATEEHDRAKLSAQIATSNHTMLNIAESVLAKEVERLTTELESRNNDGWISVNDRLPDIPDDDTCSDSVLAGCWFKDDWLVEEKQDQFLFSIGLVFQSDALREFPDGKRWIANGLSHNQITHWMPLPAAPKQEK